ncbi:MAG: 30S ribosome-binding factor RbfA [Fuerstiella sp.]|nr:30S ribosome-binding factor RbfA [Fuerstiella sp.]
MSTRRTARVASVIREIVSTAILQELRDPRIQNVTVLGVEVSADVRYAKIAVSVRGSEQETSLSLHGLNSARGYLQSKVAGSIKTRYTPELSFEIDRGIQTSFEATRILKQVLPDSCAEGALDAKPDAQNDQESPGDPVVENEASPNDDYA